MTSKLSIVVPAYNEGSRLKPSLEKIVKLKSNLLQYKKATLSHIEVVVVNDGSSDKTSDIIDKFPDVVKVSYDKNQGKGYALRQGVAKASGDLIYICDADLSTPIEEIEKFLIYSDEYDCVIGSRAAEGAREESSFFRSAMGKAGNKIIKFLLDLNINDTQCGFKMFNKKARKVFLRGEINKWGFDFEFLVNLKKAGLTIIEIPVNWVDSKHSKVSITSYMPTLAELYSVWKKNFGLNKAFLTRVYKNTQSLRRYIIVGLGTNLFNFIAFYYFNKHNFFKSVEVGNIRITDYQLLETFLYTITVIMNFSLHKMWSFKSKGWKAGELKKYIMLLVFNYVVGLGIITLLVEIFNINVNIAKIAALGVIICWNYFALKLFVYKSHGNEKSK